MKLPDAIQVNSRCATWRLSGSMPTSDHTAASDTANDAIIAPQAAEAETPLPLRRPPNAFTRKPTNGSAGISSSIASSLRSLSTFVSSSPFQFGERVRIQRLAVSEQADHDREPDRRF